MASEQCRTCGEWKVNCDECRGRGYVERDGADERCYRCDGVGLRCPRAARTSDC